MRQLFNFHITKGVLIVEHLNELNIVTI